MNKKNTSDRSWTVAMLLCAFLGGLGMHRFYAGKAGTGFVQMFTFGGFLVWAFVDFIMILTRTFKDKEGKYITR